MKAFILPFAVVARRLTGVSFGQRTCSRNLRFRALVATTPLSAVKAVAATLPATPWRLHTGLWETPDGKRCHDNGNSPGLSHTLVLIEPRLRCRECDARGKAVA
jgi:hypothetical protein